MKRTIKAMRRSGAEARLGACSSAAAVMWLLFSAVVSAQPTDAELICPTVGAGGGALSANSTRLTTESRLYQASYAAGATNDRPWLWDGGLKAFGVNANGSLGNANDWDATGIGKIPAADQRKIFTSSGPRSGINFTWDALGSAGLRFRIGSEATQTEATRSQQTLNYLRGDQSNEVSGTNPTGFRLRNVRLGAIVNSDIVLSGQENFGYEALIDINNLGSANSLAGLAYTNYLRTKSTRSSLLVVAANDGMVHGFDAATGAELFAHVPRALLQQPISGTDSRSTLVRLADQGFARRYYADGSPWVGDAYWGAAWHTVAVGTTGAGGKGAFAIDISDPQSMSATKVLWDFDGQGDAEMGYAFGQAVIGRLSDGDFYAFFGNGRGSDNQCPVLYVVRLYDGQLRKIATGGRSLGASCAAAPNGLGRPSLYDADAPGAPGYRTTDFVYAGDLQGNVWRFDLRSVNLANDPPSGAGVQLLFAARNASDEVQPITGTIEIGVAPSGVVTTPAAAMLWFGTGSYFTTGDPTSKTVQSMYAMVDRFTSLNNATSAQIVRVGQGNRGGDLVQRTINVGGNGEGTMAAGTAVRYDASGADRRDGWYLDLRQQGQSPAERMVSQPVIRSGRLLFSTLLPGAVNCIGSGNSTIFAVDPYNGLAVNQRIFINHPGVDFIASTVGIVRSLVHIDAGSRAYLYAGGTTAPGNGGSTIQFEELRPLQQTRPTGRVSWREIVK